MKTLIIVIQSMILFVIGLIVAFLTGILTGAFGILWSQKQDEKNAEDEALA